MNTDFNSYEGFLRCRGITVFVLADRCLDVKENLEYWRRTRVYTALLSIVQDVACYNDNAKLIKNFIAEVKAHEVELDALYNKAKTELDAKI